MGDYRMHATAANGLLRAVAVATTNAARKAQTVHEAFPVAAAAMGRLMSCAALLAADWKEASGRLTLEVRGDGPIGRLVAETRPDGLLRARVQHPQVDLPLRDDGKLAVGQAVGTDGWLSVLRQDLEGGEWYQSQVALQTGEIGDDFLHYLTQSEQVPSAVSVGVLIGRDGLVIGSGGVQIQAMPGCPDTLLDQVAHEFKGLKHISRRLADGESLKNLLATVLPVPIRWYPEESLNWGCWCDRRLIGETLASLDTQDLNDLIADGGAEVTCHFCRHAYQFTAAELAEMNTSNGPFHSSGP